MSVSETDNDSPKEEKDFFKRATEENGSVKEVIEDAWPGSNTYTVTVDIEALADENGRVDSEKVIGLYETVEQVLEDPGVKTVFTDSDYKTAGFQGSLEKFEAAYEEAVKSLSLGDNAMEYIEVEEQASDYLK